LLAMQKVVGSSPIIRSFSLRTDPGRPARGLGMRILRNCLPMETPVHLTAVGSQTEADILCSLLRENGIKCGDRATDVAIQGMGGSGGWREILVSEDQLDAARELLPSTPPVD
jgi:Putative prokaryotic signal transducing protein